MSHPQQFDGLCQPLPHSFGTAGDYVALLDVVFPLQLAGRLLRLLANLGPHRLPYRRDGPVARGLGKGGVNTQHLLVEVLYVVLVLLLGRLVGFRDTNQLQEAQPVGVVVNAPLGYPVPEAVHHPLAPQVAKVAQVAVNVIPVQYPVPGFQAAAAGYPHRRMGLLQGPGPDADVPQLVVLAVENEGLTLRPGLHYQVVGLGVLLPQSHRNLAVGEGGVHGGAHRKTGHQPTTAHQVQHGHLFGHPQGRLVQGQAVAQHHQRGPGSGAGQH